MLLFISRRIRKRPPRLKRLGPPRPRDFPRLRKMLPGGRHPRRPERVQKHLPMHGLLGSLPKPLPATTLLRPIKRRRFSSGPQILGVGFMVQPFQGSSRSPLPAGFTGAVVCYSWPHPGVQAQRAPASNSPRNCSRARFGSSRFAIVFFQFLSADRPEVEITEPVSRNERGVPGERTPRCRTINQPAELRSALQDLC